ncbi:MAG: hypothetical protein DPW16_09555 [Chloroflexi bacterium]|nr:hypothetical protein [Chloroflexota bacterium]
MSKRIFWGIILIVGLLANGAGPEPVNVRAQTSAESLLGTYQATIDGITYLDVEDGFYQLVFEKYRFFVTYYETILYEGHYWIDGDQLVMADEESRCVEEREGVYQWVREGDNITFIEVKETCGRRRGLFTTPVWTQVEEQIQRSDYSARFRVMHLAGFMGDPVIDIYVNDTPLPFYLRAGDISVFKYVRPGNYTVRVDFGADDPELRVPDPIVVDFEPNHTYTFALLGWVVDDTHFFAMFDETAETAFFDLTKASPSLIIHNVSGMPPIDLVEDNLKLVQHLAFGEYGWAEMPPSDEHILHFTLSEDINDTVIAMSVPPRAPGLITFYAFTGLYPGTFERDFFVEGYPHFGGEVQIRDGGERTIEDFSDEVGIGERVRYTHVVTEPRNLYVQMVSGEFDLDPFVRLYNEAGELLAANNDISWYAGPIDAAIKRYPVIPGTYIIEVGSFLDVSGGQFTVDID